MNIFTLVRVGQVLNNIAEGDIVYNILYSTQIFRLKLSGGRLKK